jgi:uncharacterized membrane protein
MESLFFRFANAIALAAEMTAVVIVAVGTIEAAIRVAGIIARPTATHGARKELWRRFGMWLLLALEFELAADIVRSVLSPTWQEIGELGAIAVIRTFLNFFLEKDLEEAGDSAASRVAG